jgi:hypothetical protein
VWARKHADETRAREAREAAEKARKEEMDAVVPKRPWDVGIEMPRMSEILGQSGLFDSIAKQYSPTEYLPRIPRIPGSGEPPNPPEPLSDEQIEAKVATYRSALESRWPSCRDYLAGIAWPAPRCRIKNEAKSFLTDVEVILTFHGARGIDFEDLEDFEILKFQDPSHHLIKTFYTGPGGWTDPQMPDGTVILTAPTGHIYTTEPHGASMFPALAQPTGELEIQPALDPPDTDRSAMMPRRKQTREQDRRDRINAERRERTELIAEEERQRQAWLAANYEPPPF